MTPQFDDRDAAILTRRHAALDVRAAAEPRPQVGDFIEFADVVCRVSHVWAWEAEGSDPAVYDVQTSDHVPKEPGAKVCRAGVEALLNIGSWRVVA